MCTVFSLHFTCVSLVDQAPKESPLCVFKPLEEIVLATSEPPTGGEKCSLMSEHVFRFPYVEKVGQESAFVMFPSNDTSGLSSSVETVPRIVLPLPSLEAGN